VVHAKPATHSTTHAAAARIGGYREQCRENDTADRQCFCTHGLSPPVSAFRINKSMLVRFPAPGITSAFG
jgi:hypothetical protein